MNVTEAEIIDVLLGHADAALVERVEQAIQDDLEAAELYAQWSGLVPVIRAQTEPARGLRDRVRQGVMGRLRAAPGGPGHSGESERPTIHVTRDKVRSLEELDLGRATAGRETGRVAPARAKTRRGLLDLEILLPAVGLFNTEHTIHDFDEIEVADGLRELRQVRAGRRLRFLSSLAAAVACFAFAGVFVNLRQHAGEGLISVERLSGEVVQTDVLSGMQRIQLRPGDRLRLPTTLVVAIGARADLRLADQSLLSASGPVVACIENPRTVRQASGSVSYRVEKGQSPEPFTVKVPQGRVIDLGTEFRVTVSEDNKTQVQVELGRVRLAPSQGQIVEASAGERAILSTTEATLEYVPAQKDLAAERARFRTHLLRSAPSVQGWKEALPPAGVRAVRYPSGELALRAWVSEAPGDAKRHPAVVYAHGGFAFDRVDWDDTILYQQAGYLVMTPSFRGENGNPGSFECFYGEASDLVAAGQYLATLPYVDPARIFVAGHSVGGTLTLLAALLPSPYSGAAAFGGSPNPQDYWGDGWTRMAPFTPGDPQENVLRSAAAFPESLHCPLRMVLGEADTQLISQSNSLAGAARAKGKSCEVWVNGGNHFTALQPSIAQSIQWFNEIGAASAPRH